MFGVVGALVAGGLLRDQLAAGFDERRYMWITAWRIFRSSPLFGSGLDTYGLRFLARRPAEHAERFGGLNPEQAHSVPVDLLADGGLLLLLPYLALIGYVAFALWRSWREIGEERPRLLLAGAGGMWVAYQTQSLVSIDVPGTALMHWLSTGAVLVVALAARGEPVRAATRRRVSGAASGLQVAIAAITLVLAWLVVAPLRADLAAAQGIALLRQGQPQAAVSRLERATDVVGYRSSYWAQLGIALANVGDLPTARDAAARAAELDEGARRWRSSTPSSLPPPATGNQRDAGARSRCSATPTTPRWRSDGERSWTARRPGRSAGSNGRRS